MTIQESPDNLHKILPQLKKLIPVFIFLVSPWFSTVSSQETPDYFEMGVELHIPDLGIYELPVAIKEQEVYLPVSYFFDLLKIKNEKVQDQRKITGFLFEPDAQFSIDPQSRQINFEGIEYELSGEDFIITPVSTYLKSDFFGRIFGLQIDFNFRSLELALKTNLELPVVRQRKLEERRSSLGKNVRLKIPDTIIERSYPFYRMGMADWGIVATQQTEGEDDLRLNFGLGTVIAGGETNVRLNYSSRIPFTSRNQFYQWRCVNNENRFLKQATAGKIYTRSTSTLFAPVVGVQLSNSPVLNRRSFGTYTLSDVTEPRWTVELYINNVLVDFTTADASGFYTFEVPLMYGNTDVQLKFYGPYGQERIERKIISIPYNFIPKNSFEYTWSAGMVENDSNSRFSRLDLNYGLSRSITLGAGVEYLSGVSSGEIMPFVGTSVRLSSNLLFSGNYSFGVKAEGLLSFRGPLNLQVDLNYIKYDEDQTAINYNYLEERKIAVSLPVRSKLFSAYTRFSLNQIILPNTEFTSAQLLLSGVFMGVSSNLTTYGIFHQRTDHPTIYSTFSQLYRLPYRFIFSPRLQYNYSDAEFSSIAVEFERPVLEHGYLKLAYENSLIRNAHIIEIGFRYNLDFAQTAMTARLGNRNSTFMQAARGSFLLDDRHGYLTARSRSSVGKGSLTIIPFLDYNGDGKKSAMEPHVEGLEIENFGGRVQYNKEKTILRIFGLQPYENIMLQLDPLSLDNIAWKISNPDILVEIAPNQFKTIYVPVAVLGEVSGMVYLKDGSLNGIGRIIVNILNEDGEKVASTLTESDGYFVYLGLKPGKYTAVIDPEQLETINYSATPLKSSFEIQPVKYGDIVDTLEFMLQEDDDSISQD